MHTFQSRIDPESSFGLSTTTEAHKRPRSAIWRIMVRHSGWFSLIAPSLITNNSCSGAPDDEETSPPDWSNSSETKCSSPKKSVFLSAKVNLRSICVRTRDIRAECAVWVWKSISPVHQHPHCTDDQKGALLPGFLRRAPQPPGQLASDGELC